MVWLGPPLLLPILFLASHVGASVDLTLLADLRLTEPQRFFLTCVSGEAGAGRGSDAWGAPLLLEKDDRIVRTPRPWQPPHLARNGSHQVTLRGFSQPSDLVGVFSCVGGAGARRTRVVYVHNNPGAHLHPDKVTHTVNKGDTALLAARVRKEKQMDVIWKSNGSYFSTLDWHEAQDGQFLLRFSDVQPPSSGIYSATYLEASPLGSAFFRLIVRGCEAGRWGPGCTKECPGCLHGGVCHDQDGECVCPPGFTGTRCEQACREGRFGQSCQEQCPGTSGCRGLTFCLPDPYGCSCGSGWRGSQCQEACAPGHFGADCRLQCQCQNGGTCDRFSGCVCPSGWHGVHCEKSDRIPQILDVASELEFNLGAMPRINCAAAGNPFPVRGSVELRKPDGTVLQSTKAIVEPDRTTAEFEVPRLTLGDSGLWECRVSTSGGQDSRRFRVNVKVPPVAQTAPRLLAKQSRQLVVSPLVSFSGDGPIASVRLHYRPQDSTMDWSAIVVDPSENVTLMNLRPKTAYSVRVQLSRPGDGGEGAWGPPTLMTTDCPGLQSEGPVQEIRAAEEGLDKQLVLAAVGSVSATCLTILAALFTLVCIRRSCRHRRRTFTYQSGSGEETILQFSSGTLTLTRRPKPQPEPLSYPVLEWEDITFEDLIGEGNFGQVIRAMIKKDGLKMNAAIKMLKEYASENDHRDFAGELEVLCKLGHHPNIINLLGACENRGYLYIAIEYAPYGNLLDFLRKSRVLETDPAFAREHGTASTLSSRQLLRFASDAANGMQYLSEKQFIHRDLAARNVLVGENLASKIADFGLSRGEEVYVKKTMGRLPVRWMAIESLNYSVYTTKSDVWSFGVLLWEIVSLGGTPYCGMTCAELYEKLPQGYRMEQPRNCDDEVYELMRQCWRDRPYERPPFAQIALQLGRMLEARKAYVNMSLFENFTYAGIDATAEEA
ncbi:PREDICTED: tyrosine-protein kinase receptor Tie-1 isoform X2 [Ceratotherium simum simum]|uniref:receptor protein-tyrosine kinase n=1 Tax=Ceratotherium simum simum TaxID=73337 RepID=A0ABM1DJI1_CERSS|nr:PREDICTED: tyrosine-protein kinase receptor Tie-1 isoform X2 [Ceratotherium simum simum]